MHLFVEDNAPREVRKCVSVCVSLQQPDRVDMKMTEEVCIGRSSIGTLVLHQVALKSLLTGVTLLHHPQLGQEGHTVKRSTPTVKDLSHDLVWMWRMVQSEGFNTV